MSFWDDISDVATNVENSVMGAISTMPKSVENNWWKGPIGIFDEYRDLGEGAVKGWEGEKAGAVENVPEPLKPPTTPNAAYDPTITAAANREGDEAQNHGMAANMLSGGYGSGGSLLSSSNVARNTLLGS